MKTIDPSFTIEKHMSRVQAYLKHMHEICLSFNFYFSVIPTTWFWRNRFRLSKLIVDGSIALAEELENELSVIAPSFERWRSGSQQKILIVRTIVSLNIEERAQLTVKDIRRELKNKVSADRISSALKHGVELGMVDVEKQGRTFYYTITEKCADEVGDRAYCMLRNKKVREMSKAINMYEMLLEQTALTAAEEKAGKMTFSDHQGILERIFWGDKGRRGRK